MIPEPQLAYVLELLKALGSSAEDFVVAGAQAMKFMLEKARGTKNIDLVLDSMRLRAESPSDPTCTRVAAKQCLLSGVFV